jgi:hypothetical protein
VSAKEVSPDQHCSIGMGARTDARSTIDNRPTHLSLIFRRRLSECGAFVPVRGVTQGGRPQPIVGHFVTVFGTGQRSCKGPIREWVHFAPTFSFNIPATFDCA